MDAQRGLSVSGHRNTVLCLHLTSDTYHVTPSGRAPRARGKFWIRRVKLRIFRPDPKSHKSEGFPAAQIFKTHKCQNTYCRSAHFSEAVKIVGAQNPRGTTWRCPLARDTVYTVVPRTVIQIQSSFTDQIQQHAHHKEKHSKPKEPLSRSAHQLRHRVLVEARHLQRLLLVESGKS